MLTAPEDQLPGRVSAPRGAATAARRRSRTNAPWWFALPAMLLFAFVVLVPSARGVYYAFTDWDGLDPSFAFVGMDNFVEMFSDPVAAQAIWHTLLIAVAVTVIQNGFGLLLALGVTMPVAVAGFVGQYVSDWNLVFAALVVSVVPILAVYFVLQRSIINGFAGGLKG
jgi:ABC-type sugar transport system permease subunit